MQLEDLLGGLTQPDFDEEWLATLPVGRIDIVVRADGRWEYCGSPFTRPSMVQLLASHLLLRDGDYCLVAPEQLLKITVEDCPFLIDGVERNVRSRSASADQRSDMARIDITMTTNVGHVFTLGCGEHVMSLQRLPATAQSATAQWIPVVTALRGMPARVSRASYYRLASWAECRVVDGVEYLQIDSAGIYHTLGRADEPTTPASQY